MKINIQKKDYVFIAALILGALIHTLCMFTPVPYNDEFLYPIVPVRFINGDNMIQHEWHLAQFSSLFSHLPVLTWLKIKGSTEGIILFLRCIYFIIHTTVACVIYKFFYSYKWWAIVAAMLFYTHMAYRMFTISYMSMLVIFLLLFCILLFLIFEKNHQQNCRLYYLLAGLCFGACCVCNPIFCIVYFIYLLTCIIIKKPANDIQRNYNKKTDERQKEEKKAIEKKMYTKEIYNLFFVKKAFLWISVGLIIAAIISIVYFYISGGTIAILFKNLKNLFITTEYGFFDSLFSKIRSAWHLFSEISLHVPFLLLALYIVLAFDIDRTKLKHKIVYLSLSVIISFVYFFGVLKVFIDGTETAYAVSLPIIIFSSVCYILTKEKNKKLFCCFWCSGLVGAFLQFFASDTLLTSFFSVCSILQITGVFFIRDLLGEIREDLLKNKRFRNPKSSKANIKKYCYALACIMLSSQIIFNIYLYTYDRIPNINKDTRVFYGPLSHFYLDDEYYNKYVSSLNDLDVIKSISKENDPVLVASRLGWMQLYLDRPIATYFPGLMSIDIVFLKLYYQQNPEKLPKHIYVPFAEQHYVFSRETAMNNVATLKELFDCTEKELSAGFLLTVNEMY